MQGHGNLTAAELPAAGFEHRSRQLLDEKRHSAGALDDRVDSVAGERVACGNLSDHIAYVARFQPVERDLRMMGSQRPLRMKLGPRRVEEQQPRHRTLLCEKLDQF